MQSSVAVVLQDWYSSRMSTMFQKCVNFWERLTSTGLGLVYCLKRRHTEALAFKIAT